MKKILHLQIPMNGKELTIPSGDVHKFANYVKDIIKDEYYLIVTPMYPGISEYVRNINLKDLEEIPQEEWYRYIINKLKEEENENEA